MAASVGAIVANIYYVQPLLPDIAPAFGLSATEIGIFAMLNPAGAGLGQLLFVPLGDIRESRGLITVMILGAAGALALTAYAREEDRRKAFAAGFAGYLVKPVEPRVLVARINALLRRSRAPLVHEHRKLRFGALLLDTAARAVQLNDEAITLTSNEFDLLLYLATHPGEIQSREKLYLQLYRREYDGADRTLDVRISHLRR